MGRFFNIFYGQNDVKEAPLILICNVFGGSAQIGNTTAWVSHISSKKALIFLIREIDTKHF